MQAGTFVRFAPLGASTYCQVRLNAARSQGLHPPIYTASAYESYPVADTLKCNDCGIYLLPLFGERKPYPIVQSRGVQWAPEFSFDGRWLAYNSGETGAPQIYLISFPAANQKHPLSNNGGVEPRWRRDGKELFYMSVDGKIMAVRIVAEQDRIKPGSPRVLFDAGLYINEPGGRHYDVTPDGERFLLLKPLTDGTSTPITVILNWTSLLH